MSQRGNPGRMVRVLVSHQNGREIAGTNIQALQSSLGLFEREAAIHEDEFAAYLNQRAVASTAAAQRGEASQVPYSRMMTSSSWLNSRSARV